MTPTQKNLWTQLLRLAREIPYCMTSERSGHRNAGYEIAAREGMEGKERVDWLHFVYEQTAQMSPYSGD